MKNKVESGHIKNPSSYVPYLVSVIALFDELKRAPKNQVCATVVRGDVPEASFRAVELVVSYLTQLES